MKNPFVQGAIIIAVAAVLAVGSNAFASRQRKLLLVGFYPNALRVPPRVPEAPAANRTAQQPAVAPDAAVPAATSTAAEPARETGTAEAGTAEKTTTAVRPPQATGAQGNPGGNSSAGSAAHAAPAAAADRLARFKPHPDRAFVEISGEEAMLLHGAGVLFLDARRTSAFEESHIAGARPFSVWEADIDEKVNALFAERSDPEQQNQPIVIYCTGGACEDSHMLAQKLWGIQFNNVYVYKDGFPDWQQRRGPVRPGGAR